MNINREEALLKECLDVFGIPAQLVKAMEELNELSVEICKELNAKNNRDNIIEGIADVTIMLCQLAIIFDLQDSDVGNVIKSKLERLQHTVNLEKGGGE